MEYIDKLSLNTNDETIKKLLKQLGYNYEKKLWHQMGETLIQVRRNTTFGKDERLVELYNNFIILFQEHLNPLELSKYLVRCSQQLERDGSIKFLEKVLTSELYKGKKGDERQAELIVLLEILRYKLLIISIGDDQKEGDNDMNIEGLEKKSNDLQAVSDDLGKIREEVELSDDDIPHIVYSMLYKTNMILEKIKDNADNFFNDSMLYLAYTSLLDIPNSEQIALASDICLAALLGKKTYNFGELVTNQILLTLTPDTKYDWLPKLVNAFNVGDIKTFLATCKAQIGKNEVANVLQKNEQFLQQKIRIMALINNVFHKKPSDRVLSFIEISKECSLDVKEVEFLLMKAFSLGVLKGKINQVQNNVSIKYVQPRVLNLEQISKIKASLAAWVKAVQQSTNDLSRSIELTQKNAE